MLTNEIYKILKEILDAPALIYAPITASTATHADLKKCKKNLTLFEHMTLTNRPEIRAQEAIFPHLIAAGYQVQREECYKFLGRRRIFDFVVSNGKEQVIVELKHFSAHQTDRFLGLLGPIPSKEENRIQSLYKDFHKPRPEKIPFIQLGLFTAVEKFYSRDNDFVKRDESGSHFVRVYAKKIKCENYQAEAQQQLGAWEFRDLYRCPQRKATAKDFCIGPKAVYKSATQVTIEGRVNYFLGVAADNSTCD